MKTNSQKLILERLLKSIFKENCYSIVNTYVDIVARLRKKNGLRYCIVYMKSVRLHITRYMCNQPLFTNKSGVSIDKDGFPKHFVFLKDKSLSNPRLVLTLLSYTRSLVPDKNETNSRIVKLDSITDPYKGKDYTIPNWFIKKFVNKFNLSLSKPSYSDNDHYLSVKGSPNGKASKSSLWSLLCHNPNTLEYIRYITGSYFDCISNFYTKLIIFHRDLLDESKNMLGKLSIVHDPELKERVIAMVDYTTQFTLKPIHTQLLNLLRNFECDRTFTQDPFHKWSDNSQSFHSLDLSAATDRFPISLQEKLLSHIYNDREFALNWRKLLIDRPYMFDSKEYFYSVGQPMGAYTSWAAFTLTHHLVVHWAAYLCKVENFKDYIILGDDIVIKHNKIASKYTTLMTRFGVDISLEKTHTSVGMYEFAKRWIKDNREISGLSLKGIMNNINSIHVVYMNIFKYYLRIPSLRIDLLDTCGNIYKGLLLNNRIKSKNSIIKSLYDFHHSIKFSFDILTYQELRCYLNNKFIKVDEFYMWPESLVPQKMREILSHGMVSPAVSLGQKVSRQFGILSDSKLKPDLLIEWPLIKGFINHIDKMSSLINSFKGGKTPLIELISDLNLNNLDGIMKSKTNVKDLLFLDKLWKNSMTKYLESLVEETKKEDDDGRGLERHVMNSYMFGFKKTFKTTFIGLKDFETDLQERFASLKSDLEYMRLPEYYERKQSLEERVQQYVCNHSTGVIDWDKFPL